MSKAMVKIISVVCTMCLMVSVCFTQTNFTSAEAPLPGSVITENDIPQQYKWLTASDFQSGGSLLGAAYTSQDTDYIHNSDEFLDHTVFTAKVSFSPSGENRLYLGGSWKGVFFNGTQNGIQLCRASNGALIKRFSDAEAGCQLIQNSDLKLTVSFEFLNNDRTNTDLKIGVFFNGNLYQNEYITCTGFNTADLKQLIKLYVKNSALTVASASTPVPAYLDDYTTTTIGLSYGVKNSTNAIGRSNVDGTLFGVRVTFANANQWLQYGGNGSGWYGIRFQLNGANLQAGCSTSELKNYSGTNTSVVFDPKIAFGDGSETFVGKTFDLHISTEIVNHDGQGDALDVRYGFYFNGKLYNNAYVYSYDTAGTVGNYVGFQSQIPAYSAIGSISNKKIDENATQLSINDITADDNVYAYNVIHPAYSRIGRYLAASTFNNTVFGANVTLTQGGSTQTYFQIGGNGEWDGIRFKVDEKNLVIESAGVTSTTVTPDFIGAETFNGTPTSIALSTEIKNLDGGASADDVIYGIYIGNRLFTNLFAYNCADSLTNRVVFNNWNSGSTFSPVDKTSSYTVPDTLTEVSFNDFSIADGTYANATNVIGDCTNTKIENLTEAVFTGFVNFSTERTTVQGQTNSQSTICYAAASSAGDGSDGIRISNHHTWVPTPDGTLDVSFFGSQHVRLDPQTAGTTLVGVPIKLQVVILPADFDGDEEATDALIGILINDKLYNETFFKIARGLESVGTYTRVYSNGSTIDVASPAAQLPTDLVTLTPKEFGVEGTWNCVGNSGVKYGAVTSNYTVDNHSGDAMSLMGKAVSMDIEYSGTNYLHFAAPDLQSWNGLRIMTTADSIKIESSISGAGTCQSVTCTSDLAGVDFTKKFNLTITAEAYNAEDAKIGVWFNGKLYRNMYLKWSGVVSSMNASVNIIPWNGGSITLTAPEAKVPTSEDGYTCKSLTDYGFAYKTYTGNSEAKTIAGLSTEKVVISGKLALTGNAHMVLLGDWLGYYLGIDWTTNNVMLKHTNGIFANPITVPLIDVANGQFAFDLVQTVVDADYDGEKDDVQLELWVDGTYARDYFFMDYIPTSPTVSRVFPDGGSLTIKQELTNEAEEGAYYNLADGPYLATAVTTSSDGTRTYNIGDEINIPGDYSVTSTVGSTEYTYSVYLWKQGDYHPDGQNDIRDLVALKKYSAGVNISKAGAKAAKLYENTANGLIECRKVLLGVAQYEEVNTALHYSVDSEGDAVMPISGFWGPRMIDSSLSGAETNLIQDKYYSQIADLGVNLINYIELDAANGNGALNQVLQNLSLAEKYNIGVYVNDASLNENTTASQLAERLSLYGSFSSFKGIHVYDEPIGNSYNPTDSSTQKKISDIAGISKLLNKYTNLSAYINLYPSMTGIENYYPYLSEYVSSCNPRVLSYDNYPFTNGDNYAAHHGLINMAHTSYFKNLKAAATSAAQSNIPFWAYVQSGNNFSLNAETTTNHNPTMSQVFWNVNTALAYGAKGIQYFPLIQPNYYGAVAKDENGNITSQDFGRNGLIGANGEPTRWYNFAKQVNQWIAKVDHILMSCSGTEVIACGDYAQRATGISTNAAVNGTTVSSSNSDYGAIVGVFDYYGKKAYYVVNNHYDNSGENGDVYDTVTLNFGSSKNLTVYEESGEPTTSQASSLSLNIRYGCAALVVAD